MYILYTIYDRYTSHNNHNHNHNSHNREGYFAVGALKSRFPSCSNSFVLFFAPSIKLFCFSLTAIAVRSDDVALGPTCGQLVHLAFIRIVSVNRGICAGQLGAKKAMARRRQRVGSHL